MWTCSCWGRAGSSDPAVFIISGAAPSKCSYAAEDVLFWHGVQVKEACQAQRVQAWVQPWSKIQELWTCVAGNWPYRSAWDHQGLLRQQHFHPWQIEFASVCISVLVIFLGIFSVWFFFFNFMALQVLGKFISLASPRLNWRVLCVQYGMYWAASSKAEQQG